MKNIIKLAVLLGVLIGATLSSPAQDAVPPPTPDYQPLSDQQLDQLLGPIALYPDPLIAQILPAATLPTQIVMADRYMQSGGDTNQVDQQPWDASVRGLAHYPTVLQWMDDNLNWTTELGQAFLNQQPDVMNSIQRLRAVAQKLGNLPSTPQQQVVVSPTYIEIVPADPQVIYVPVYDPTVIYYQQPFGPPFITFGIGFSVGWWLNCDFDWGHRHVVVWNHSHPRPPNWWHESPHQRDAVFVSQTHAWHPTTRPSSVGNMRGDRGWNNNPAVRQPTPMNPHPNSPGNRPGNFHGANAPGNNGSGNIIIRGDNNGHPNIPPPNMHNNAGPTIHDNIPGRNNNPPGQAIPSPAPRVNPTPSVRPGSTPNSGAFIGIQSSQNTRDFSNRGRQSIQTTRPSPPVQHSSPPPAAAPRPSAPANNGGGGNNGGGHSQQPRH
ncbi:MAG TPA: DUF3300 domain-containing protein [Verrucomicrobiae bacterium]